MYSVQPSAEIPPGPSSDALFTFATGWMFENGSVREARVAT
jgi:hypothetical protein